MCIHQWVGPLGDKLAISMIQSDGLLTIWTASRVSSSDGSSELCFSKGFNRVTSPPDANGEEAQGLTCVCGSDVSSNETTSANTCVESWQSCDAQLPAKKDTGCSNGGTEARLRGNFFPCFWSEHIAFKVRRKNKVRTQPQTSEKNAKSKFFFFC